MAAYMGKDGKVNIGAATVAFCDSWTLNTGVGTADITGYGASSRAFVQTIREWSGSFTCTMDRSDTDQADLMDQFEDGVLADIAFQLYPSTSYWSGNGQMTGMTVNSAVDDKISVSFDFQGNGALAYITT